MTDRYLDHTQNVIRLCREWKEHNGIIVAFDFDNTVFDYHNNGDVYDSVISILRTCKDMGCTLILFTSCEESKYDFMLEYLSSIGIHPDYINEQPDYIPFKGKKIYYNILLDDRAGLESAYKVLLDTVNQMK